MAYFILDLDTQQMLVRSMVWSARHTDQPNEGCKEQFQAEIEKNNVRTNRYILFHYTLGLKINTWILKKCDVSHDWSDGIDNNSCINYARSVLFECERAQYKVRLALRHQ
jgi:hypothetical protein